MLYKILDILRQENDFISGEKISRILGVSRTAVWKNIKKLKEKGYDISSVSNKGYMFIEHSKAEDIFNEIEIRNSLDTNIFAKDIYFFEEIGSTNDYAKGLLAKGDIKEGTAIVANYQSNGHGRLERDWECEKGVGILLSIVLRPSFQLIYISRISLIASIAVCEAINELGIKSNIKWPNDIVINKKKVCGILCEATAQIDSIDHTIVGIGINVNNKKFDKGGAKNATSIYIEKGKIIKRSSLIAAIIQKFEVLYYSYTEYENFEPFLEKYKSLCININRDVSVIYKGEQILGKAVDITKYGEIVIKTNDKTINIASGEVSLRGGDGEYI